MSAVVDWFANNNGELYPTKIPPEHQAQIITVCLSVAGEGADKNGGSLSGDSRCRRWRLLPNRVLLRSRDSPVYLRDHRQPWTQRLAFRSCVCMREVQASRLLLMPQQARSARLG